MTATSIVPQAKNRQRAATGAGFALAGLAASLIGGIRADTSEVDGFGLVAAVPTIYWVGVALAIVATVLAAVEVAKEAPVVGVQIPALWIPALWIGVLHTAPALAADGVRFAPVYENLGLVRSFAQATGASSLAQPVQGWPGFYAAFSPSLAGLDPTVLDGLLRLWPTIITSILAALTAALARRAYPTQPLVGPLSALVFIVGWWMGQDYFSPLSVALVAYLAMVVVLESGPLRPQGSLSSVAPLLNRFAIAGGDRPEARSPAPFVAVLILAFAVVVSDPVAPLFIAAALLILGLHGRRVAWRLLVMTVVAYLVWNLVVAEPWWTTVYDGPSVDFGGIWPEGQAAPGAGSVSPSTGHLWVTRVQTALTAVTVGAILVLGGVTASDSARHLRPALPLALLALSPFVVSTVIGYDRGTMATVLAFALPVTSILAARFLAMLSSRSGLIAVPVVAVVMAPLFLMARFGNESFEMVTDIDREAVEVAYAAATESSLLVADNPFLPWADHPIRARGHSYLRAEPTAAWLEALVAAGREADADEVLVVLTPSQSAWRTNVEGQPSRSLEKIGQWATTRSGVRALLGHREAWVLVVEVENPAGER